jgi:uncharacterized SAM-binding protein YcdF (DUF218 family)
MRDVREDSDKPRRRPAARWVARAVLGVLLVGVLIVGGTFFRVWDVARGDGERRVDMVLVLGAAQYDGKPSAALRARLEQTLDIYQKGLTKHVVTVGGRKPGDEYTEAQAGRKWLIGHGVPADRVTNLDVGSDTLGSVRAAAGLAHQRGWSTALIVTDPWHSLRARTMATYEGLTSWASPTRSGPMVRTRETQLEQIYRETGALLYFRVTHASAQVLGLG